MRVGDRKNIEPMFYGTQQNYFTRSHKHPLHIFLQPWRGGGGGGGVRGGNPCTQKTAPAKFTQM